MITCGIFVLLQNFKGCFGTILILYTAGQYASIIKQTFLVSSYHCSINYPPNMLFNKAYESFVPLKSKNTTISPGISN